MGPLFPFLFLVLVVVIVVVIGASLKTDKSKKVFALLILIVSLILFGIIIFQINAHLKPEYVFQDAFGFVPAPEVTNLRGEISSAFDVYESWLTFTAPQDVVNEIIKRNEYSEISPDDAVSEGFLKVEGAPFSWPNTISAQGKFYRSSSFSSGKHDILIHEQSKGILFFYTSRLQ